MYGVIGVHDERRVSLQVATESLLPDLLLSVEIGGAAEYCESGIGQVRSDSTIIA
jgi:hypothetical protein